MQGGSGENVTIARFTKVIMVYMKFTVIHCVVCKQSVNFQVLLDQVFTTGNKFIIEHNDKKKVLCCGSVNRSVQRDMDYHFFSCLQASQSGLRVSPLCLKCDLSQKKSKFTVVLKTVFISQTYHCLSLDISPDVSYMLS